MPDNAAAGEDKMLERVRRLLAKAEGAATEAERDAYNGKAAELIARYGIEEALLAAQSPQPQTAGDRVVDLDAPYARDKGSLLVAVAGPLGVRAVLRTGRARGVSVLSMHLFGMQSDLARVDVLYTSLLVQAAHGLAVARPRDAAESVSAYRRSWMTGFAYTIQTRLLAAESSVQNEAEQARSSKGNQSGPSVSLVLADRADIVDRTVAQAYPRLRTARSRMLSGSGSEAGAAAARRADLGGQRLSRRSRTALH